MRQLCKKTEIKRPRNPKYLINIFHPTSLSSFLPLSPSPPLPPQKHMYVTIGCSGSAIQASRKSEETAHLQQLKEVTKYLFGIPERSMSSAFPTNGITTTFSSSGRPALKNFQRYIKHIHVDDNSTIAINIFINH